MFSQMNKANDYRTWKQKDNAVEKPLNPASMTDFPDLVKDANKKTVFEGTSLANRLKDAIAAEEEAAIQKRLKKGDTPEQILREQCTVLPLKGNKAYTPCLEVPEWVTDDLKPFVMPPFRPKTLTQVAEERRWRRLGINPKDLYLYENREEIEDDRVSLPSLPENHEEFISEDAEQDIPLE